MNIIVLYNPKSGPDTLNINEFQSNILKTFNSEVNQKFEIEFINIIDSDFNKKLDDINLKIVKAIIIAGGDGTISSNIDLLVKNDILLGILPFGTFNNFAKDNGIPNNLREALKIIKDFNFTEIDVGKLNNIYFINNSSIGLYTRSVKLREKTKKNII